MTKYIPLILTSLVLAAVGQVSLKQAMNQVGGFGTLSLQNIFEFIIKVSGNPFAWLGFALYIVSAFMWLIVLSHTSLSFAYPFASVTFVLILFLSTIVLNEGISALRWAGSIVIIIGLLMITRS